VPEVAITDNHVAHILEHTIIFDNVEARLNPNAPHVIAGMQHVQLHMNKLLGGIDPRTMKMEGPINPVLAGILGDPSLPMGTPSMMQLPPVIPGGGPGATPQNPPGPGGGPPPGNNSPQGPTQPQSPPGMASQPAQTLPKTGMPGPQLNAA
jgi:hypothetical protein